MRTKQEIVENWLPRYTSRPLKDFTKYILLTNFQKYVEIFAEHFNVPIVGANANMPNASAEGITIINFGMGSANAATIMRSEEHTSELQSRPHLVCRLLLEKKKTIQQDHTYGCFIYFDTLPLSFYRFEPFFDNPTAFRSYFCDFSRMFLSAYCHKSNDSHAD